jgi:hypothetical protein
MVPGRRSHLFSHVVGCVVVWCEVFAHGWTAGLIFFHMLLVVWWFGVAGRRSHLFSHVAGCVVVWCEVFALFVGQGRLQVSPFFTYCWLCGGLV